MLSRSTSGAGLAGRGIGSPTVSEGAGYRQLWAQVTGMQAGGGGGDGPAAGEETTVEDLLRVVKQLPLDAEAAPVSCSGFWADRFLTPCCLLLRCCSWHRPQSLPVGFRVSCCTAAESTAGPNQLDPREAARRVTVRLPDSASHSMTWLKSDVLKYEVAEASTVLQVVARGLHHLDSRALAALLKELAKVHHHSPAVLPVFSCASARQQQMASSGALIISKCAAAISTLCLCREPHRFRAHVQSFRRLQAGLPGRSAEIFDWLRVLPSSHPLASLCDVYTYTTIIAQVQLLQNVAASPGRTVADAPLIPGAGALLRHTCSPLPWPCRRFNKVSLIYLSWMRSVARGRGWARLWHLRRRCAPAASPSTVTPSPPS